MLRLSVWGPLYIKTLRIDRRIQIREYSTRFSAQKKPLTTSISCSKIKHPLSFSFSSFLLFFFQNFCNFFFNLKQNSNRFFFLTQSLKDTRNKNKNKKRDKNKNKNETKTQTRTQTRKQITTLGQNTNLEKLQRKRNRIG